jgi:hypothetical protein
MLMVRNVDACDTGHVLPRNLLDLTLALLVARIGADHAQHALAPHQLALAALLFHRRLHFHE